MAEIRSAVRVVLRELPPDQQLLVACSGGADSLALAAATAHEARNAGRGAPALATVDHGLQAGSRERADAVLAEGRRLGFGETLRLDAAVGTRGGPEGAARTARYELLDGAADGLDAVVLLGHTLDDQAETVLLGLGRGSGSRSLAGMERRRGRYLRPLLGVRRVTTRAACAALGLEPWDDPHNADRRYRRVRVRTEALPLLEDVLGGGVAAALARTGDLLRDDLDALDRWAADVLATFPPAVVDGSAPCATTPGGKALEVAPLEALPRAVRTRVLRLWTGRASLTAERTAALDALVTRWHGQGPVELPGGARVQRVDGRLELEGAPER